MGLVYPPHDPSVHTRYGGDAQTFLHYCPHGDAAAAKHRAHNWWQARAVGLRHGWTPHDASRSDGCSCSGPEQQQQSYAS